ncbi:hypothetical protein ACJRO7_015540 [Eucalyptus globulus]|uniref:EG45-like domain containing protein n=1 Tax=Eucalyptus globulus TaxID=34317 RepID=A0ABD3L7L4_EUCGL
MGQIVMAIVALLSLIRKEMGATTRCNGYKADQFPPENLFVAVSEGLWDNGAACGRRYRLWCLSGSNRLCKDGTSLCPSTILLSTNGFSTISESPSAKINAEYIQI